MSKIKWNDAHIVWSNNDYTWDDVKLVEEVIEAVGKVILGSQQRLDNWVYEHPEKSKNLIRLICKIKDKTITKTKIKNENIKISVEDVDLLREEILKVTVEKIL